MRFDNKVVVITGSGGGLGKAYALYFASKGAKVVVNDLGTSGTGTGSSSKAADEVVKEIIQKGGVAVANYDSVENGEKIIETAIKSFGRIDVLINNAGILRDKSFRKMEKTDWDLIVKVHLNGVYSCSKAAFEYMVQQKFGRIINISSPAGLYGNFGQVNYSMAKSGILGFSKSLGKEGEKYNVLTNVIAPLAATRMTETVMAKDLLELLKVEYIIPVVAYLSHEDCTDNGQIYELGGKWIANLRWQRSEGVTFEGEMTLEEVKKKWNQVNSFDKNFEYPTDSNSSISKMLDLASKAQNKTSQEILKSDKIFNMIAGYLSTEEGKKLNSKVQSVFQFDILDKKGGKLVQTWTIDLKDEGKCVKGAPSKYDAMFTLGDEDFLKLVEGKLNATTAFATGVMKIKGNIGKATKFTPDLFPKPTEENVTKYLKAKF